MVQLSDSSLPSPKASSLPLATIMQSTAEHIQAVLAGASLTKCLAQTPSAQYAAVQAHDFYAMRQLGWAQVVCAQLVPKKPKKALLYAHLLHALILLEAACRWGGSGSGSATVRARSAQRPAGVPVYTVHTVVDQAVRAASLLRLRFHKRFINGVLRRYQRERVELLKKAASQASAVWNFPFWWVQAVQQAYPEQWRSILLHSNAPAALTLRVNQRRCSVAQYLQQLEAAEVAAFHPGAEAIVLAKSTSVQQLPGYQEGWFSVQDAHAQLAGHLLPLKEGDYVLDACAAPGGKTAHLLERFDIECVALDASAQRLERVEQNLQRLGLLNEQVHIQEGDARQPDSWWSGRQFDAILADVPCTASGVVRRHPDIRWLRRMTDVKATAQLQAEICSALWPTLKPGGYFLYVTCSVFPAEGEEQIAAFMARHPDARRLPAPGQLLPTPELDTTPAQAATKTATDEAMSSVVHDFDALAAEAQALVRAGGDGFFYALLQKEG